MNFFTKIYKLGTFFCVAIKHYIQWNLYKLIMLGLYQNYNFFINL